jgi:uncharacterized protein (TIGR02266 family)
MGSRRKNKSRKAKAKKTPPLPSPEQVMGAVLEAISGPLLAANHRAHPRVVVEVAVGLETESHFFAGLSGDVSEGGVFVQTYRDLPVGSAVEVQFDLPETRLRAHGRVRWHREKSDSSPPGVGIAFEELGAADRRAIQKFCEAREPLYYDVEHG